MTGFTSHVFSKRTFIKPINTQGYQSTMEQTNINQFDQVNHPSHYTKGRKFEPIEVIDDWELDYYTGNALKYISRAGRKDDLIVDLEKAVWYLQRRIKIEKEQRDPDPF